MPVPWVFCLRLECSYKSAVSDQSLLPGNSWGECPLIGEHVFAIHYIDPLTLISHCLICLPLVTNKWSQSSCVVILFWLSFACFLLCLPLSSRCLFIATTPKCPNQVLQLPSK
ncbi:hypothetical protein HanIR_Chr10g0465731 [Helianthus annuus]|nr:hypothetical protein HanIR_Chr10g0465731 [Helianthus annuus]